MKAIIPRIKIGQTFGGPEYLGCSNTGRRAVIARPRICSGRYLVGTESDVHDARNSVLYVCQVVDGKRVIRIGKTRKVWQFTTRAAAVAKFKAINQPVLDYNKAERERARKYRNAVDRGDINAALTHAD